MKYELFLSNYLRAIYSDAGDDRFAYLQMQIGGLSSPRTAKLLNLAASCMDEGERYVETGVFTGYTIISASFDNGKPVLGIDSFDMKGPNSSVGCEMNPDEIREILKRNLKHFQVGGHVVEGDFRTITLEGKTGVSFVDARHDYQSVIDNLAWLEPSLVKDAVIIFDDVDCEGVDQAILDWLHGHKNYELLYLSKSKNKMHRTPTYDSTFVNGLAVMHYKGN
jgi:predicted O-methyltransferase YrrM